MFRSLLLTLALVACTSKPGSDGAEDTAEDSADDSGTPRVPDADRDGYDADEDCDEGDPSVNPGAAERCDGLDQDCDGQVDDDVLSVWYQDADGDGYGDAAVTTDDCDPGEGYVANAEDCDDGAGSVHPNADELCNDLDDDCDGVADDDATDLGTWYQDADGDGYGDEGTATQTCDPAVGMVAAGGDCDDADGGVSPEAEESCDGVDQDCDGDIDDNPADPATWYADYDGDGFGDLSVETWDCAAPDGFVGDATDCDDTDAGVNPDAEEVCDEVDQDCDGVADDAASDLDLFYADSDGDGYGDADAWTWACTAPDGYVDDATDCDDGDDGVYPSATETCDDVDEDCDGTADEGAVDMSTWYADGDRDNYGDALTSVSACDKPSGYVSNSTDCDDSDDDIWPGAPEDCDGLDQSCDDVVDDDADCPCDMDWYGDHAYMFCDSKAKWTSAQSKCEDRGYHLLTIDDSAENTWAIDTAASVSTRSYWWMGYNDRTAEGTWAWEDGSTSTYTNWHTGEPNDSSGEDCGQLYRWSDYTWNDAECNDDYYYVCESY